MEYVKGEDLSTIVKQQGPFSIPVALDAIKQAATGLGFAHASGIVHRDVKPANLLLDQHGVIKVLDMGLARIDSPDEEENARHLTSTGMMMGTIDFMAPEQAMDTRSADGRSDIYSLGCTLFYLLTGRPLFLDETAMKRLLALQNEPSPSLSAIRNDVSPELEQLYQRMVAKNPDERPQSMEDVIAEIDRLTSQGSETAQNPITEDSALQAFLVAQSAEHSATIIKDDQGTVDGSQTGLSLREPDTNPPLRSTKQERAGRGRTPLVVGALGLLLLIGLLCNPFRDSQSDAPSNEGTIATSPSPESKKLVESVTTEESPPPHEELLPLDEWLEGREVLTVAQDGSGQFTSIQDALNSLKSGQAVKVLDRGPYRETVRLFNFSPQDTGLVSEAGTVIEPIQFPQILFTQIGMPGITFKMPMAFGSVVSLSLGESIEKIAI